MRPGSTYVVYNAHLHDIESVHPYWELAVKSMTELCELHKLDSKNQHKYVVTTLTEALTWYAQDNASVFANYGM